MIKAKITKIDGDVVYLLSEHGDDLEANRLDIDFGILEGDSLFLRTESGDFKFRRLEKEEAQEGEPHYYDANWKKREDEHSLVIAEDTLKIAERTVELLEKADRLETEATENIQSRIIWCVCIVLVAVLVGAILISN